MEWDPRHLIWIPDAISGTFSSGRPVVALIAGLESAVLWWNILVRRWATCCLAVSCAISAGARRCDWSGTGRRASAVGRGVQVAIGG